MNKNNTFPVKKAVNKKRKNHYVDKNEMNVEIIYYKETGEITNKLGKMIMDICKRFARHPQFRRYNKKGNVQEELIGEGMVACIKALKSFNPFKSTKPNPVAYFTEVAKNGFRAYLNKHYNYENFQREMVADKCHSLNIPFVDEIKKDMIEKKQNGELSNEEVLKKYFDD